MLSKKNLMVTMVTDEFLENCIILQKSVATIGFIWFLWFQKCILLYIFVQIFLEMRCIRSHISFFRVNSILSEKCQKLQLLLSLCSFKCEIHAYLFNLCTENSAFAYDKYHILISDIEMTKFSLNSNRMGICHRLHTIRSDAIKKLTNNPWVDQCAGYFYLRGDNCMLLAYRP